MYLPAIRLFNETGGFNDSGHASLLSAKLIVISHAVARKNDLLFLLIVMIRTTIYFYSAPPPPFWTLSKILQNPANISGFPEDGNAK